MEIKLEEVIAELRGKLEQSESAVKALEKQIRDGEVGTFQTKITALEAVVADKDSEIKALSEKIDELNKTITDKGVELLAKDEKISEIIKAKDVAEAEINAIKLKEKVAARVAQYATKIGTEIKDLDASVAEKIGTLSDEQFDTMLSLIVEKKIVADTTTVDNTDDDDKTADAATAAIDGAGDTTVVDPASTAKDEIEDEITIARKAFAAVMAKKDDEGGDN